MIGSLSDAFDYCLVWFRFLDFATSFDLNTEHHGRCAYNCVALALSLCHRSFSALVSTYRLISHFQMVASIPNL